MEATWASNWIGCDVCKFPSQKQQWWNHIKFYNKKQFHWFHHCLYLEGKCIEKIPLRMFQNAWHYAWCSMLRNLVNTQLLFLFALRSTSRCLCIGIFWLPPPTLGITSCLINFTGPRQIRYSGSQKNRFHLSLILRGSTLRFLIGEVEIEVDDSKAWKYSTVR